MDKDHALAFAKMSQVVPANEHPVSWRLKLGLLVPPLAVIGARLAIGDGWGIFESPIQARGYATLVAALSFLAFTSLLVVIASATNRWSRCPALIAAFALMTPIIVAVAWASLQPLVIDASRADRPLMFSAPEFRPIGILVPLVASFLASIGGWLLTPWLARRALKTATTVVLVLSSATTIVAIGMAARYPDPDRYLGSLRIVESLEPMVSLSEEGEYRGMGIERDYHGRKQQRRVGSIVVEREVVSWWNCNLRIHAGDGGGRSSSHEFTSYDPVTVRHDERRGLWVAHGPPVEALGQHGLLAISERGAPISVTVADLGPRISPPHEWIALAIFGLLVAFLAVLLGRRFRRSVLRIDNGREAIVSEGGIVAFSDGHLPARIQLAHRRPRGPVLIVSKTPWSTVGYRDAGSNEMGWTILRGSRKECSKRVRSQIATMQWLTFAAAALTVAPLVVFFLTTLP